MVPPGAVVKSHPTSFAGEIPPAQAANASAGVSKGPQATKSVSQEGVLEMVIVPPPPWSSIKKNQVAFGSPPTQDELSPAIGSLP